MDSNLKAMLSGWGLVGVAYVIESALLPVVGDGRLYEFARGVHAASCAIAIGLFAYSCVFSLLSMYHTYRSWREAVSEQRSATK